MTPIAGAEPEPRLAYRTKIAKMKKLKKLMMLVQMTPARSTG